MVGGLEDQHVTRSAPSGNSNPTLRQALLPSRRPGDELDDVPLSSRRNMEPEASRAVENIVSGLRWRDHFRYHIRDWIVIIICIILDVILNIIHPFARFVGKINIDSVSFPLKKNTVPLWAVPIIALVIPAVVFLGFLVKRRDKRDFHQALLGLLTAVAVTAVFTDAIKDGVGRARPDFFYRCFPDGNDLYTPAPQSEVMCTGDPATIREGHKSFPSGHSSWSFAGLGYLSFYLAGKLTLFDRRGYSSRIFIVLVPLLLAAMVAVSRVSDYWHHWQDVTVGGLLGFTIAYLSYKQFFPDFSDKMSAYPYPYIQRNSPATLPTRTNQAGWNGNAPPASRANGGTYDLEAAQI
ncbi:unnamed protein product [Calypogeia fissa]